MHNFKKFIAVIFICVIPYSFAVASEYIEVDVKIDDQFKLNMDVKSPCIISKSRAFYNTYDSFGATGVKIEYVGNSTDGNDSVAEDDDKDEDILLACGSNSTIAHFFYKSESNINDLVYIYEIPVIYNSNYPYTRKYDFFVSFPPALKPISSSRPYEVVEGNKLHFVFDYRNEINFRSDDLQIIFVLRDLPPGTSVYKMSGVEIYADNDSIQAYRKLEKYVPDIEKLFKETLDLNLSEKKIVAFITDITKLPSEYDAAAMSIGSNVILFDESEISDTSEYTLLQMFVHEVTHALTDSTDLFGELDATWFMEGLAVFHEHYLIDKYLTKTRDDADKYQVLSAYPKLHFSDLRNLYSYEFDYGFVWDNEYRDVADAYAHAGLVAYKLFLDHPNVFLDLNQELRKPRIRYECELCDTNRIFSALRSITGKNKEEILYPFKRESLPSEYEDLFALNISQKASAKIRDEYLSENVKNPATSTVKMISTTTPVAQVSNLIKPSKKSTGSVSSDGNSLIQSNPVEHKMASITDDVTQTVVSSTTPKRNMGRQFISWLVGLFD